MLRILVRFRGAQVLRHGDFAWWGIRFFVSDASPPVLISRSVSSMLWLLYVGPFVPHVVSGRVERGRCNLPPCPPLRGENRGEEELECHIAGNSMSVLCTTDGSSSVSFFDDVSIHFRFGYSIAT